MTALAHHNLVRLPASIRRLSVATWISAAIIAALVIIAIAAPVLAPHDPNATNLANSLAPPSADHLLGQDGSGRDILSRLMYGARLSLLGPLIVVALSLLIGVPAGLLAGYRRGLADAVISRVSDLVFGFPALLLAIIVVATFGPGFWTASLAISIIYIPLLARVVRGVVLVEVGKLYVDACRVQGFTGLRTAVLHVLPNVAPTVIAQATLGFGYALLDLAGLAFLGLGVQPPTADWGNMLADGRQNVLISNGEVIYASIAIAISVVSFHLLGDALARRFGVDL